MRTSRGLRLLSCLRSFHVGLGLPLRFLLARIASKQPVDEAAAAATC